MPELLNNHSTGPKTPDGKKRSSLNSTRHGLTAKSLVLKEEERSQYQELLFDYLEDLDPQNGVEADLVHQIVAARWRIQRTWALETETIDIAVHRNAARVSAEFQDASAVRRTALACQDLATNGNILHLYNRYEVSLTRMYNKLLRELDRRQAARKAGEQRRSAEEQREVAQTKAAEAEQVPEVTETPGDPRTCRVLLTIPKSLLRNELPQLVPQPRRDPAIPPKEDKIA